MKHYTRQKTSGLFAKDFDIGGAAVGSRVGCYEVGFKLLQTSFFFRREFAVGFADLVDRFP